MTHNKCWYTPTSNEIPSSREGKRLSPILYGNNSPHGPPSQIREGRLWRRQMVVWLSGSGRFLPASCPRQIRPRTQESSVQTRKHRSESTCDQIQKAHRLPPASFQPFWKPFVLGFWNIPACLWSKTSFKSVFEAFITILLHISIVWPFHLISS